MLNRGELDGRGGLRGMKVVCLILKISNIFQHTHSNTHTYTQTPTQIYIQMYANTYTHTPKTMKHKIRYYDTLTSSTHTNTH